MAQCGDKPKRIAFGVAPLGIISIGIVPMGVHAVGNLWMPCSEHLTQHSTHQH